MKDLHDYRKSYEKGELNEFDLPSHWHPLFEEWFQQADQSPEIEEANAMHLSTIGLDGYPKSRVVLLKSYTDQALWFYTNYNSEKGKAIETNNKVSTSFFWPSLEKQVIFTGKALKVSASESDEYFYSRPVGSQKGAIVSPQSEVISSRESLVKALESLNDDSLKRPEHWGGYRIVPEKVEFWQGRAHRLHDRIRYQMVNDDWSMERLAP